MRPIQSLLFLFASAIVLATAEAKPFLHPLFSDHAVLQRDGDIRIWGWTTPGEKVRVQIGPEQREGTAGADGRWLVSVKAPKTGGPYELEGDGAKKIRRKNILIGDVWLCSGQSNMEWSVANSNNPREEIAKGSHSQIRLFTVPKQIAAAPVDSIESAWQECQPETVKNFSAVGYYFGRALREHDAKVPIGLVHSSWGGTIAEAWTSGDSLMALPDFQDAVSDVKAWAREDSANTPEARESKYQEKLAKWWKDNDTEGAAKAQEAYDSSAWPVMAVPGNWEDSVLPDFDGLVWFRKVVTLPDSWVGKDLELSLGAIDDDDVTYVNGVEVGSVSGWNQKRFYKVAAEHWQSGDNLIAVRVLDTSGGGGFHGEASGMRLKPITRVQEPPIVLAGYWEYEVSKPFSEMTPRPNRFGGNPNVTTVLYNGMIAPLVPMTIKGAIWYQGESNANRPTQYRTLLPTMITDWRKQFDVGNFPFHIVQLANFMTRETSPQESTWAALREAQALTAQHDPNVGLAVAIDIGEAGDIHPRNKQDVGKRLAMAERGLSRPVYRAMEVKGSAVRLKFDHGQGLTSNGKLHGFAIASSDKKYVWANAEIQGEDVIVTAPQVRQPIAVRYGWGNNPKCTLYNGKGLPAVPFRTDVEAATVQRGYTNLFDGSSLSGWKQINGTAKYEVKDGTIVGTTAKGSPNSFLCTEKEYGDFELQFEVKLIDGQLNSGCQIRSQSLPDYKGGRVHGYQVEIATNGTAGYIYDEARRGWLSEDRSNAEAKDAFKHGAWNHYRILCMGDRMQTWVNQVPVGNVTDTMTPSGFIGLQVHSVKGDPQWQVAWRNLWLREISKR
ncbi:MAG: DUF1080 domain-containing protein [Verrucomicrobiaceae bacterium]|nr:DUF1080 domain-containing protein [Verrucomicrobiaceae bacterium]